uniref:Uncharacterized protein n=1 Tax=Opuntia streptacantha TaxID=393608 RepID=A0A7C9CY98_OPUST
MASNTCRASVNFHNLAYPTSIVVQETTSFSSMSSKKHFASSMLPHFVYISRIALFNIKQDLIPFFSTCKCNILPSSKFPIFEHAEKILTIVTSFGLTFSTSIAWNNSKAISERPL